MKQIKPEHLKVGDTVGIVSPSSSMLEFPRRLQRGIKYLSENLGLTVLLGANARGCITDTSGTPEQRVDDIHQFLLNPSVKAIICSTGGYNSIDLLSLLDYDLFIRNPKIFCGFSDVTALTNSITKKTGLVTFSGPTVLPSFGVYESLNEFTREYFLKTLFSLNPVGVLNSTKEYSDEDLYWDRDDTRPLKYKPAKPYSVLYGVNSVSGPLWGGNLDTFSMLAGTEFMPTLSGAILMVEDSTRNPSLFLRNIKHLELQGTFSQIHGLLVGRFLTCSVTWRSALLECLKEIGVKNNIPIVIDLDIGHTVPLITLPISIRVEINVPEGVVTILEPAVL